MKLESVKTKEVAFLILPNVSNISAKKGPCAKVTVIVKDMNSAFGVNALQSEITNVITNPEVLDMV